jgi:hypothetical protein
MSMLLFGLLRIRRSPGVEESEDDDESTEKEVVELGHNEARVEEGNKVTCPSCDAALGVPPGSDPPFRFTCPTCSSSIRVLP